MRKKDWYSNLGCGGAIVILIIGAAVFIFGSWITFWVSYFFGWLAKLWIGNYIVQGFAFFGKDISLEQIPYIAGFLGWIGSFFKSSEIVKNIKDNKNN